MLAKVKEDHGFEVLAAPPESSPLEIATEGYPRKGTKVLRFTMVELGDYQCLHCVNVTSTITWCTKADTGCAPRERINSNSRAPTDASSRRCRKNSAESFRDTEFETLNREHGLDIDAETCVFPGNGARMDHATAVEA